MRSSPISMRAKSHRISAARIESPPAGIWRNFPGGRPTGFLVMHLKKSLPRFALLLVFVAPLRAAEEKTAVPFRSIAFDAACAAAKSEGKLVFIDFYTTWCEPCKRLDKDTWTDAG